MSKEVDLPLTRLLDSAEDKFRSHSSESLHARACWIAHEIVRRRLQMNKGRLIAIRQSCRLEAIEEVLRLVIVAASNALSSMARVWVVASSIGHVTMHDHDSLSSLLIEQRDAIVHDEATVTIYYKKQSS